MNPLKLQNHPILVAEDCEHDVMAIKRVWQKLKFENTLHIVNTGDECLDFLFSRGQYSSQESMPSPGLLLLDINMPRVNGFDVLKELRASFKYSHLPIIMLTTSKMLEDKIKSYKLGANAYIVKPTGFVALEECIRRIVEFYQFVQIIETDGE